MASAQDFSARGVQTSAGSQLADDRRRSPRNAGRGLVCLSLEDRTERARLADYSSGGIAIRTLAPLEQGEILYCAVPSLAVCTRARVAHVRRGLFSTTAGLEYLATLSDFS